jgi:PTH1 family peptidyl-tRNA hydrolase
VNPSFLIAGLGNPGREYAQTRHNAGFLLVQELARSWGVEWRELSRFHALVADAKHDAQRIWLAQPLTYMNVSGKSVGALVRYYQVPLTQTLVVVDDADLPLGTLRLRPTGSSGGHHGLESIEAHLGTRAYPRLRLGIGRTQAEVRRITGHVLGRFSSEEAGLFAQVLQQGIAQVTSWLDEGIEKAMARYNGPVKREEQL